MSFSETFDYSSSQTRISNVQSQIQSQLDECNASLALFQTVTGYSDIVSTQIQTLNIQKTQFESRRNILQSTQDEITNLLNSSDADKSLLYQNFLVLNCDKIDYMRRMLFNFETGLQDPVLLELLADTTNTPEAKTAVAQVLYSKYQLDTNYIFGLSLVM